MYVIEKWLNGPRNFYVGKAIYLTVGNDKRLIDVLHKGKTPIAEELLLTALQNLLSKPTPVKTSKATFETAEMPVDADPVLQSIQQEWKKPYQQMNYKRHQLDQYKGNTPEMIAIRKPLVFEILELEQQCMKMWKKRDHYLEHGKLPDVSERKVELPTDPVELGKLIESIKKNIRRNRKLIHQHPDKPVYAQKYQEYKQQYESVTGKAYEEKD
jgi:hypothetical protein